MNGFPSIVKFMEYVHPEPNTGCWLWVGRYNGKGYGRFPVNAAEMGAHRISYTLFIGPIPKDIQVLHRCDVRCCVNPAHLFLGTNSDNVADRVQKGRSALGERNGKTNLKKEDVLYIRNSGISTPLLMKKFNMTESGIRLILNRTNWKHI